jgi:hypothetical protein
LQQRRIRRANNSGHLPEMPTSTHSLRDLSLIPPRHCSNRSILLILTAYAKRQCESTRQNLTANVCFSAVQRMSVPNGQTSSKLWSLNTVTGHHARGLFGEIGHCTLTTKPFSSLMLCYKVVQLHPSRGSNDMAAVYQSSGAMCLVPVSNPTTHGAGRF